jgi:hypothetical protein
MDYLFGTWALGEYRQHQLSEKHITPVEPPRQATLEFTFWPPNPDGTLIKKLTVPIVNGIVSVSFSVTNNSAVQAKNVAIWIRVHDGCRFKEDPQGLKTWQSLGNFVVKGTLATEIYRGVFLQPIQLEIIPASGIDSFTIDFPYTCDECAPVSADIKDTQKLIVFIKQPEQFGKR